MNRFVAAASIGLLSMVAHFGGCRADVVTDWEPVSADAAAASAAATCWPPLRRPGTTSRPPWLNT